MYCEYPVIPPLIVKPVIFALIVKLKEFNDKRPPTAIVGVADGVIIVFTVDN